MRSEREIFQDIRTLCYLPQIECEQNFEIGTFSHVRRKLLISAACDLPWVRTLQWVTPMLIVVRHGSKYILTMTQRGRNVVKWGNGKKVLLCSKNAQQCDAKLHNHLLEWRNIAQKRPIAPISMQNCRIWIFRTFLQLLARHMYSRDDKSCHYV